MRNIFDEKVNSRTEMRENELRNSKEVNSTSETALRVIPSKETATDALKQMIIPFILSGFGNMGAGIIQGTITEQRWPVFIQIPQLFSLITPLLGLKGNITMTLSSRLSTQANLQRLKDRKMRDEIIVGNLALAQLQSSLVGFFAPLILLLIDLGLSNIGTETETGDKRKDNKTWTWNTYVVITGICVTTTNVASIILCIMQCLLICACKLKFKINPDNVASPIAASCGDIVTMALLAIFSKYFFGFYETSLLWILIFVILVFAVLTPCWAICAYRNQYTKTSVFSGFGPILVSLLIQCIAGVITRNAINQFTLLSPFQAIINGFGGDLVAILCSRLSTYLHKTTILYRLPKSEPNICMNPCSIFFTGSTISRFTLFLVLIAFPSQIPFLFITIYSQEHSKVTAIFFLLYAIASTAQVIIVLYTAFCFVQLLWSIGCDPDNSAIPIMTATADLLGSILLLIAFIFLKHSNDPNSLNLE